MHWAPGQAFQNEEVERAADEIDFSAFQGSGIGDRGLARVGLRTLCLTFLGIDNNSRKRVG